MKKNYLITIVLCCVSIFATTQIIHVPVDQPTIQAGIDEANDGETVLVDPGTYFENINFNGKNITVASLFLNTQDTNYISQTIIYGNQEESVVRFENEETLEAALIGFTITNGGGESGGGIHCTNSSPTLDHLLITKNSLSSKGYNYGGGVYCYNASPEITNLTISENEALGYESKGGGLYLAEYSAPVIQQLTIIDNKTEFKGGGIYCSFSDPLIENSLIKDNITMDNESHGDNGGGGIYCYYSDPVLKNVIIEENVSANNGGGIYFQYSHPLFDTANRCSVFSNTAIMGNDLFVDWYPPEIVNVYLESFTVLYPTDFHACPVDLFNLNIINGMIPQVDADLYISPEGDNKNTGLTPQEPLKTINYAFKILRADESHHHTIHLLEGIYSPSTNDEFFPVNIPDFISIAGVSIDDVILDAEEQSGVIQVYDNTENSLSGFTVTGGSERGILCYRSNPILENLEIKDNSSSGLYLHYSEPNIQNVNITGNVSEYYGGGIISYNSNPTLLDVVITNNSAGYSGGGIFLEDSYPTLQNVRINNNSAHYGGGGISCNASILTLINVSIINNKATDDQAKGGGIYCSSSTIKFDSVDRCNIYSNSACKGSDLYSGTPQEVIVDTFTVLYPKSFHASPYENFTFDILHGKYQQVEADVYVSPEGNNENSGLTTEDPLKTIHHAISILLVDSLNPRTIHLLDGTYSQSTNGERFPVILPDYISLCGTSEDNVILDAAGLCSVIELEDNTTSMLSNITVTGGSGCGINVENADPVLQNITVSENFGKGINCTDAAPIIQDVKVMSNEGSGIYCKNSSPDLHNVEISANSADKGGGIYCEESSPNLQNVIIKDNVAFGGGYWDNGSGGGIYCENSNPIFQDVRIFNNNGKWGGGVYCKNSSPEMTLVSIYNNTAERGGGLYNITYYSLGPEFDTLNRCNIYLNKATMGNDLYSNKMLHVIVDTFTVLYPTQFHAFPIDSITFDILHCKIEQVAANIYVSPDGDDANSGLTAEEPLKTIHHALSFMVADSTNPHTIYLSEGTFSPSTTEEFFPVNLTKYISLQGGVRDNVILDAEVSASVVRVINNPETNISGLTITGGGGNTPNGGGVECQNSKLNIHDVIINDNVSFGHEGEHGSGGGIYCFNSDLSMNEVIISNNSTRMDWWPGRGDGGGIYIEESSAIIQNAWISENWAEVGGGINCANSSTSLFNVTITENSGLLGGGVFCGDSTILKNVIISNNEALGFEDEMYSHGEGGGINSWGSPFLKNVVIQNNLSNHGGGLYINGNPIMENVTIKNNSADIGGGICNFGEAQPDFDNLNRCNIYQNTAFDGNDLYSENQMEVIVDTFSVFHATDYFASPIKNFTFNILHGLIEQENADLFISPEGDNDNSGLSEEFPFKNIGYAFSRILVDSLNPHTIYLGEGTYGPSTSGELYPLNIPDFIHLSGESKNNTILDAEEESGVFYIDQNQSTNLSYLTVTGGANAFLDGALGRAIYCRNSNPIFNNLTISNNLAGGIYLAESNAVMQNLSIVNNTADYGSGIYCGGSSPRLFDVTISGNQANGSGGGIYCSHSNPELENVSFNNNSANYSGGGISCSYDSYLRLQNVTLLQNEARSGGGIYCDKSVIDLSNVTMAENIAELEGGALYCEYSEVFVTNSVLWNNEPYEIYFEADIHIPILDSLWIVWSDVEGGKEDIINHNWATIKWMEGNIDTDPLFSGADEHPFALSTFSPCIDAGTPDTTGLFLPPYDYEGNPRIWNQRIDMGAYEWNNVDVEEVELQVAGCKLQVYPNPTLGISDIRYRTPTKEGDIRYVSLEVFDMQGRKLKILLNEKQSPGDYLIEIDISNLPPGIYIVCLKTAFDIISEKLILLK